MSIGVLTKRAYERRVFPIKRKSIEKEDRRVAQSRNEHHRHVAWARPFAPSPYARSKPRTRATPCAHRWTLTRSACSNATLCLPLITVFSLSPSCILTVHPLCATSDRGPYLLNRQGRLCHWCGLSCAQAHDMQSVVTVSPSLDLCTHYCRLAQWYSLTAKQHVTMNNEVYNDGVAFQMYQAGS